MTTLHIYLIVITLAMMLFVIKGNLNTFSKIFVLRLTGADQQPYQTAHMVYNGSVIIHLQFMWSNLQIRLLSAHMALLTKLVT